MAHPRLIEPRTRFAFVVGSSLLTLVAAALTGYTVWRVTESDFNLEPPSQVRSMGAVQETATAVPTSRVVRLTPVPVIATLAVSTEAALASTRERASGLLSAEPASTPSAQPTATARARAPELVTNGSFEQGASAWNVEDGAAPATGNLATEGTVVLPIPAGGGYADQMLAVVSGETYELRGSGQLSGEGDTGLLGVVYRDGSGNRLRDLEPRPITFTGTKFKEKLLVFTVPAEVTLVRVYVYKEPGSAQYEVDGISVRNVNTP